MSTVIATHAVGNMDAWVAGGNERAELFKQFCSGYRIFRHPTENKVALVWENVDSKKFDAALNHPDMARAKARHTVLEPVELYFEVEGGR